MMMCARHIWVLWDKGGGGMNKWYIPDAYYPGVSGEKHACKPRGGLLFK